MIFGSDTWAGQNREWTTKANESPDNSELNGHNIDMETKMLTVQDVSVISELFWIFYGWKIVNYQSFTFFFLFGFSSCIFYLGINVFILFIRRKNCMWPVSEFILYLSKNFLCLNIMTVYEGQYDVTNSTGEEWKSQTPINALSYGLCCPSLLD